MNCLRYILLLCALGSSTVALAQTSEKWWQYGEEYHARKEYAFAIEYFKMLTSKKAYKTRAVYRLVQCYRGLNNKEEAIYYASKLKSISKNDSAAVLYGCVMKENGQYLEAKKEFLRLSNNNPSNVFYKELLVSCDSSLLWSRRRTAWRVANMKPLNTEYSEISPAVQNNESLVFSSNREGIVIKKKSGFADAAYYDLYETTKEEGNFAAPRLLSTFINSVHHEFAPSFSASGDTVYFTKSIDRNRANDDTVNRLKLYSSVRNSSKNWSQSHIFILNDSLSSFAHPFMDPSGNMFFFASDMQGGYGNLDIYVCFRKDSVWSRPFNLGPVVNTSANETYPFYQDGNLYFSSDSHKGMGGYDVYKAIQKNGDWVKTLNMAAPLNTSSDDFSFVLTPDGKRGFFCSNREGGEGQEDIYQIIFSE